MSSQAVLQPSGHPLLHRQFPVMTGMRGVAILWVIFAHLPLHLPALIERFQHRWGIGVDFFLAISGFLVTRSFFQCDLIAAREGGGAWAGAREFLVRRLSRIFPPYYAMLAMIVALALFVDHGLYERLEQSGAVLWSYAAFLSNYTMPSMMEQVPAFLIMTWSLSYQEQFYAVLVGVYLLARRHFGALILALAVASMGARFYMVLWGWPDGAHSAHLLMWTHLRFDAVAWACLAWIHYDRLGFLWATRERARASNVAAVAALAAVLMGHAFVPGDFAQAVIYCFKGPALALIVRALAEADSSRSLFASLMRLPVLNAIGLAAYEIYLLNTLGQAAVIRLGISNPWIFAGLVYAVSLVSGYAFYRLYGRPMKKLLRRRFTAVSGAAPATA